MYVCMYVCIRTYILLDDATILQAHWAYADIVDFTGLCMCVYKSIYVCMYVYEHTYS